MRGRPPVDGHAITLHHRFPNETPELFQRMAADLVALKSDVLVSVGNVASPYARNATETIPVVFILVADPIGSKLVDSLGPAQREHPPVELAAFAWADADGLLDGSLGQRPGVLCKNGESRGGRIRRAGRT